MKPLDLTGMRFGLLAVSEKASTDGRRVKWRCACDCGSSRDVIASNLTSGHTTTCGGPAHRCKPAGTKVTSHPAYQVWREMHRRCSDPNSTSYRYYGGKGISVCPEWSSFEAFVSDMGERPSRKHQIDRRNSTDNYCKDTCQWMTAGENSRNRAFVKLNDASAETVKKMLSAGKTSREIAAAVGVSRASVLDVSRGRTWKHINPPTVAPDGVIQQ